MKTDIFLGKGLSEKKLNVSLTGDWIHLIRCVPNDEVAVVDMGELVDAGSEDVKVSSPWFEILATGPECKFFLPEYAGKKVFLPATAIGAKAWCYPVGTNEIVCREAYFEAKGHEAPPLAIFWEE